MLNETGPLVAPPGKNEAQTSFTVQLRRGAVYTFELKTPATRLAMKVGKAAAPRSDDYGGLMRDRGRSARRILPGPNQPTTYRITISGRGAFLPANFELKVWERWPINGHVPPDAWAR